MQTEIAMVVMCTENNILILTFYRRIWFYFSQESKSRPHCVVFSSERGTLYKQTTLRIGFQCSYGDNFEAQCLVKKIYMPSKSKHIDYYCDVCSKSSIDIGYVPISLRKIFVNRKSIW